MVMDGEGEEGAAGGEGEEEEEEEEEEEDDEGGRGGRDETEAGGGRRTKGDPAPSWSTTGRVAATGGSGLTAGSVAGL